MEWDDATIPAKCHDCGRVYFVSMPEHDVPGAVCRDCWEAWGVLTMDDLCVSSSTSGNGDVHEPTLVDELRAEVARLKVYEAIFVKHKKHYSSGCACHIDEESDDGSEEFSENGCRITKWCDFHKWHMARRTDAAGDATT